MKNKNYRLVGKLLASLTMFSLLWFTACNNNDDPKPPVEIQFANAMKVVSESPVVPHTITLTLSKAASKNGSVKLTASANASDWANFPSTIEITEGNTAAQFTITPKDNAVLDEARAITFTLSEPTSGFKLGAQSTMVVNITDDEAPAQANFNVNSTSISEDNDVEGVTVVINISAPAPGTGNLTVNFSSDNATYGTHFTTLPAATGNAVSVPFTPGQTSVSFKVIPVDNLDVNANRVVTFTLAASSSNAVTVGTILTAHAFTITDNETPSVITFVNASSSVSEGNGEGIDVSLALDPQTVGTGSITITLASDNAEYDTHYITNPAATAGSLTVPVGSGATAVSFKIIPVDNSDIEANRVVNFTLGAATGIVVAGVLNNTHQVTITEDDVITSIADVRAMYTGSDATISSGIKIQGVVISNNNNYTNRNLFLQDATGSIVVRFASAHSFAQGDEIKVNVGGGLLTRDAGSGNTGPLQIGGTPGIANNTGIKVGDGVLPNHEVITTAQLNSGNYESKLVRVEGVGFYDANGINNLRFDGGNGLGSNKFGDANSNNSILRVESYAPFATSLIPAGTGHLQGIASVFNAAKQIIPQEATDIFASNESAIVTVNPTSLDFNDVNNGATADLTFDVSGTSLIADVVISAPSSYSVSLDGANFSNTVTVPFATANANPVTVTVRFSPATGSDQSISGSIVLKSLSASVKKVDVTGNETGNGAPTAQTLALWTFEVSVPTTVGPHGAEEGLKKDNANALGFHASASTVYSNPAGNGSLESFSSNFWAIEDYYQFSLNSTGYSNIVLSWDQTRSSTGPESFALYYSTDGTNFTKHGDDYSVTVATWSTSTPNPANTITRDLSSITALNNMSTLVFRLVAMSAPSGTAGSNRVDNFKVEGVQN